MVITLVVIRTRGSVIPAMLFHASANICAFTMWEPDAQLLSLGPWIVEQLRRVGGSRFELNRNGLVGRV
jgi:hypothetical protein